MSGRGTYILGAVWKDESDARRDRIASAVGSWGLPALAVVGHPVDNAKQERARRLCFAALVDDLGRRGVRRLLIEARTSSLDRRDRQMVDALRSQRRLPEGLHVDVARPLQESMLWLPDVVAGVVRAELDGRPRWRAERDGTIDEVRVTLA